METDASPLKNALLASDLCVQADAFMDTEMSEVPYVLACKGCDPSNADRLEKTIFNLSEEIASKGIPPDLIDAAIHQMELSRLRNHRRPLPFWTHPVHALCPGQTAWMRP